MPCDSILAAMKYLLNTNRCIFSLHVVGTCKSSLKCKRECFDRINGAEFSYQELTLICSSRYLRSHPSKFWVGGNDKQQMTNNSHPLYKYSLQNYKYQ